MGRIDRAEDRPPEAKGGQAAPQEAIDLSNLDAFKSHPRILPLRERYKRDARLAEYAVARLMNDLEELNTVRFRTQGRVAFTSIQGRVKEEDSFLKKLHRSCQELGPTRGISRETLDLAYSGIKDLAGVRVSCPYFDEVVPAVNEFVRPTLAERGYATDLRGDAGFQDRDYLEQGDDRGYRSYHFFVRVPTVVDIFGTVELCLCEVQARTELQHVWAEKSHDLLYKPGEGWGPPDARVIELMKAVSDNLRVVDTYLVDIRRRVRDGEAS